MVLGKALKDVGVDLSWAVPHFQGAPVWGLDYNVSKIERRPWCYPAITYHHMRGQDIGKLWTFEHAWYQRGKDTSVHRHVKSISSRGWRAGLTNWTICPWILCLVNFENPWRTIKRLVEQIFDVFSGRLLLENVPSRSKSASKCVRRDETSVSKDLIQSGWMIDRLARYMADMDSATFKGGSLRRPIIAGARGCHERIDLRRFPQCGTPSGTIVEASRRFGLLRGSSVMVAPSIWGIAVVWQTRLLLWAEQMGSRVLKSERVCMRQKSKKCDPECPHEQIMIPDAAIAAFLKLLLAVLGRLKGGGVARGLGVVRAAGRATVALCRDSELAGRLPGRAEEREGPEMVGNSK
ncbi:hypothetical protein EK21DRAFT_83683 [Setomelanomma holmii]|uniref:Uncharacterized protein n=1 Tax=Setomelanomma holmii TaxID=210430 RepID=A0A9P4HML0_9PLEO|nr:hypothetical protein EK21DRAFT_83683 [Setomelanomma holmii]